MNRDLIILSLVLLAMPMLLCSEAPLCDYYVKGTIADVQFGPLPDTAAPTPAPKCDYYVLGTVSNVYFRDEDVGVADPKIVCFISVDESTNNVTTHNNIYHSSKSTSLCEYAVKLLWDQSPVWMLGTYSTSASVANKVCALQKAYAKSKFF